MKSKSLFRAAVLYVLLCTSPIKGLSQTWTSIMNGDWNAPGTWLLVGIGTPTPPATLLSGMKVNIRHTVAWPTTFSSGLDIYAGAELNIDGGIFNVANGVSMKNWGRFIGNKGTLRQCVFLGCGSSGSSASGTWTTLEGGYTNMDSMYIEIAGDWVCSAGGLRTMTNTCLRTGQNFSVSGSASRDTLRNAIIELGLHGSGNFQLSDAAFVFDNARIWINSSGGSGNISLNSGTISGNISAIKVNSASSAVIVSSSVSGSVNLIRYCMPNPWNYSDPDNKLYGKTLDCASTNSMTSNCFSSILPVNFLSFNASANKNLVGLNWSTSDETDSKGFELQRAVRNEWKTIGWVGSKTSGKTETHEYDYAFTDTVHASGTYAYRVKHLSFDGRVKFSASRSVMVSNRETIIYPNSDHLLSFIFKNEIPNIVVVYNNAGQKLAQYRVGSQVFKVPRTNREQLIVRMIFRNGTSENIKVPAY